MARHTSKTYTCFLILLGMFFFSSGIHSDPDEGVQKELISTSQNSADQRVISNNAFSVGEKLSFDIDWGPSTVGTATISIPQVVTRNGRGAFEVRSRVLSNRFISALYPVDDQITSYIDTLGIYSLGFEKKLSEGKWRQERKFVLDQENNTAFSQRDTVDIPAYCQDVLSAFFYVRTQELNLGDKIEIPNYDNDKVYDIVVEVQKKQQIRVPAGKFNCIVVEPKLKTEGLFKHQGRIHIYLSDDERKIPVLMVSKVIFGHVAAKLTNIETEFLP